MAKQPKKLIANNKKVYHDYFLEETFEAGIALAGTEVKSMRMGKCSIKESFIHIEDGEVILYGMHISPYEKGNIFNKDPLRPRKLLMHKKEIQKMVGKIAQKGYTIVPVEVYFKGSLVKVQVALAKGKKLYDTPVRKRKHRHPIHYNKASEILHRYFPESNNRPPPVTPVLSNHSCWLQPYIPYVR